MAEVYGESREGLPLGFQKVQMSNGYEYVVEAANLPREAIRVVSRPDEMGDRKDFQLRKTGEPIEGSMTLQRETETVPDPEVGDRFSYTQRGSSTAYTWIVGNVTPITSTDAFDTIEISCYRVEL